MNASMPTITADQISRPGDGTATIAILSELDGVRLRYHLYFTDSISYCVFTVKAFHAPELEWKLLWAIPSGRYRYPQGPIDNAALLDPASPVIARPRERDAASLAASWNKIVQDLASHAEQILSPGQ
ncbi:hypothetical protein [Nocardia sp. NPDC003963]